MEKVGLRSRLRDIGLTDNQTEEVCSAFDKRSRHMDIVSFVAAVERLGVPRGRVYAMLREGGVDDSVLITVFSRADLKKAGMDEERVQDIAFYD